MKKITGLLVVLFLLVAARPAEAILGTVKGYVSPGTNSVKIGDKFAVKVMLETGENRVSAISLNLGLDTTKVKVNSVVANKTVFSGVFVEKESGGIIGIYGISSVSTANLPKGTFEVATINLEAVANGAANITSKSFEITGPSTTSDYSYGLDWQTGVVNVANTENGTDGVLKFKVAFSGVVGGAQCATNWPVDVMVMEKNGNTKTYANVSLGSDRTGQVLLTGISTKDNLAVFIKGPRHLQVKYGKNNQNEFYNQPGGGIVVEADATKTTVYDFTKYPLMAGDVNRDGKVDGIDFSTVKTDVSKRSEGNNMTADLNGNCKLESQDLTLLMLSIKDKQEQLY